MDDIRPREVVYELEEDMGSEVVRRPGCLLRLLPNCESLGG